MIALIALNSLSAFLLGAALIRKRWRTLAWRCSTCRCIMVLEYHRDGGWVRMEHGCGDAQLRTFATPQNPVVFRWGYDDGPTG